jgi:hypothetical protein
VASAVAIPAAVTVPVSTAATERRVAVLDGLVGLDAGRLLLGCLPARLAGGLADGAAVVVVRAADGLLVACDLGDTGAV